ncbi:hypothetical protein ABEB36_014196 [Hypothenemus hampei]|uniref:NACHT domain-containing protein n=1 Tax=Hypothenemus hampei TaxID=57062 RepID=A0ABD1E3K4_HYPHA
MLTRNHRCDSDSDELSQNAELFNVIRKRLKEGKLISEEARLEKIKQYLRNGADINAMDRNNRDNTVLHVAVKKDCKIIVEFLLQQPKVNTRIPNADGKTAKDLAHDLNNQTIIDLFTEYVQKKIPSKRKFNNSNEESATKKPKFSSQKDSVAFNTQKKSKKRKSDNNIIPNKKEQLDNLAMPSEGIKLAEHGNIFQLKLLMLCLWRATYTEESNRKKYKAFRLATEMPNAEKFDDIAFQHKEENSEKWKFRLLQAKHKEGEKPSDPLPKIKLRELLSMDDDEAFSLQKYFHSYLKIRQRSKENSMYSVFSDSEIEDVIVITNTAFDSDKEASIFVKDTKDIKMDALLKTEKPDTSVYKLRDEENNTIINKLKIIFENSSDFYKLIELLSEHIFSNKQIDKTNVLKEYYYPLINEILKVDVESTGKDQKYFINLDNFIEKKGVNGETLSEEATKIRAALIREIAFRKGKVKIPEIDQGFGNNELPDDEAELNKLSKKVAEFVKNQEKFTVTNFEQYHVILAQKVLNIETKKLSSKFIQESISSRNKKPTVLSKYKGYFIQALNKALNKNNTKKDLENLNFDISVAFGRSELSSDETTLRTLAAKLAETIKQNNKLFAEEFRNVHVGLTEEVIDIKTRKFHNVFIHGQEKKDGKVKELSPEAKKFRRILLEEIENQNIQITIENQETTIKELKGPMLYNLLSSSKIKVSMGLAKGFKVEKNPEIENVDLFAEQMKNLINHYSHDEEQRIVKIDNKIETVLNISNEDFKIFNDNIKKLAGYALINRFNKVRFSTAFLKSGHLPDNIDKFRTKLRELLGNDQFESLFEYELKFDKNFNTFEDGELYRKLPVVYSENDIKKFFSKLKFIVNYPNRMEISDLLGTEIKEKNKTLDSKVFQFSYYENLHNWMVDRVGTFYTPAKTKKLFQQILESLSLGTIDGFNKTYFADSSQEYKFEEYNILARFLLGDKQVLEFICQDLFLGHTRIVQEFQELQALDSSNIQEYTRNFGHIFLYLKQLEAHDFRSKVYEVLKDTSKFNLIVIECNAQQEIEGLYHNLDRVIRPNKKKKVIFITTKDNDALAKKFATDSTKYKCKVDSSGFRNLTKESRQRLLEREIILQEKRISLNKLMDESDESAKKIIDVKTLVQLMTNEEIEIGSKPPGTSDLEGAYSELFEEIEIKTFVDKLLEESSDVYIISRIPGSAKENRLLQSLNGNIEETKINDLKGQIGILNKQDFRKAINQRIQVAHDLFKEKDFKQICHNNPKKKIYWIHLKSGGDKFTFILAQIYNPDFYLEGQRFNNEVVIEKYVKEQLGSSTLSEIFIIGGKDRSEIMNWLQFSNDEEKTQFKENCNNNKIKFATSQSDLEVSFQELSKQNEAQTLHLLKFVQDHLVWYKTRGSLENLRKYRSKNYRNTKLLIGEDDLVKIIMDNKVSIIAGDPGMGKSTTLVKLYRLKYKLESDIEKSIIKSHWVIRINLKDHLEGIRNVDFSNSYLETEKINIITEFLLQVDGSLSDDFERNLLNMALVKGYFTQPLLITFDGFDEVLDEADRDKIITLLIHLKETTKVKFWITTRLHYEKTLECALSTFAINLDPMDDLTIKKFIKKYLKNHLSLMLTHNEFKEIFDNNDEVIESKKVQKYTEAFLSKMREVFKRDVTKFIGIPLQLYLMLEGSAGHFKAWLRNNNVQSPNFNYLGNDIWEVYENFIDGKYKTYFKKVDVTVALRQKLDKATFDGYHKDLAKFLILKSTQKESLEEFKDIVLSAGIVRSDGNNIDFIHSTFMAYFAAKALMSWIGKWKQKIIRAFLNAKLLKEKMTDIQLQEAYYDKGILFQAAQENNVGIASFVLDNFKNANVEARDQYGNSVLYLAITHNRWDITKFLVEKGANVDDKDNYGNTLLQNVAFLKRWDITKLLIEKGANIDAISKNGNTILHNAAASGLYDLVKFLVNEKKADVNAKDNIGNTVLHKVASGNMDIVKFLVNEKDADVNAKNNDGNTVLHYFATPGNLNIVKFLVFKGANLEAVNRDGKTILHRAAIFGNLDMVKFLVNEKCADVNVIANDGNTVLHLAAKSGDLNIVKFLVNEKNANVNVIAIDGNTVLHLAAESGDLAIVKFLVAKGANVEAITNHGNTVLYNAVFLKRWDIIKFLIEKGANVDATKRNGNTILHSAAVSGNLDIVKFLVNEKHIDVNVVANDGNTVLHNAARSRNLDIVKFLVAKGANVEVINRDGNTVLQDAARSGSLNIVKFLINEINALVNVKANDGNTVLHNAARSGNLDIIKFLVNEKNVDINTKCKNGNTVLHDAARSGNLDIVKFLVNEKNVDVNVKCNDSNTVLHWAARSGRLDIVKFLVAKGANVEAINKDGNTVLHWAAKFEHLDIVKFLVDEGANVEAIDKYGNTVLHWSAASGHLYIVEFLVEKGIDITLKNKNDVTGLDLAKQFREQEIIYLLQHTMINNLQLQKWKGMNEKHLLVPHFAPFSRRFLVIRIPFYKLSFKNTTK